MSARRDSSSAGGSRDGAQRSSGGRGGTEEGAGGASGQGADASLRAFAGGAAQEREISAARFVNALDAYAAGSEDFSDVFIHVAVIDLLSQPGRLSWLDVEDLLLNVPIAWTTLQRAYQSPGPAPATLAMIDALPRKAYRYFPATQEASTCVICFEPYEGDTELIELGCKHEFHSSCITKWLLKHNTCPICRKPLPEAASSDEPKPESTSASAPPRPQTTPVEVPSSSNRPHAHAATGSSAQAPAAGSFGSAATRVLTRWFRDRRHFCRRREATDESGEVRDNSDFSDTRNDRTQTRRTRRRLQEAPQRSDASLRPADGSWTQGIGEPDHRAISLMLPGVQPRARGFLFVTVRGLRPPDGDSAPSNDRTGST